MDGVSVSVRRAARCSAAPQLAFDIAPAPPPVPVWVAPGRRAIEDDAFPFEAISAVAEAESWRKEVHRPVHYVHKWWARRLGSVFRAAVLGALAPVGTDVMRAFYEPTRFPGAVVLDPFMGSGVTLAEALKLGARAIGRDINPVAHFLVRNALGRHSRTSVLEAFRKLERDVAPDIRRWYRARLPDGRECEGLYWFWVKHLPCPSCSDRVDLFSSRIFSRHAYAAKNPTAQASCPCCGEVVETRHDATEATCPSCACRFDPQHGPVHGQRASCPSCGHDFAVAKVVRAQGGPPRHRLYAKMVLDPEGRKRYLRADMFDLELHAAAEAELARRSGAFPIAPIAPGHNTDQALGWGYRSWHEFFSARQLLCLSLLGEGVRVIPDQATRELMTCLFSGALEFNNMFASFKGEGTGAVRHMFAHHVLKPQRTPLEANLWGTPASSGSFSGLFASRILRALDHAENPTEIRLRPGAAPEKVGSLSEPLGHDPAASFAEFQEGEARLYLACGDSARTDVADASVDAVVTDPPFFDNVHYSELADFFHVWQRHLLGDHGTRTAATTRAVGEVQDGDPAAFSRKLGAVLAECSRVLRPDGLLVFSYHHSRDEGWSSVLEALTRAGFAIVATHPVKAEMSVAAPKSQAKEPIDLDVLIVCRRWIPAAVSDAEPNPWPEAEAVAAEQVARLRAGGRNLSRNDVRVVVMAQAARFLSRVAAPDAEAWRLTGGDAEAVIKRVYASV